MSDETSSAIPRRDFVSQAALSALVLGSACTAGSMTPAPAVAPAPTGPRATQWDDTWTTRLTSRHRAVFEQAEPDLGSSVGYAARYLNGMRDALGAGDAQAVIVIRHAAIPLVLNDAMWEKYGIGEERKIKGAGDTWVTRNPVAVRRASAAAGAGGAAAVAGAPDAEPSGRAEANLAWMHAHGHIILGCNVAFTGYASILASRTKGNRTEILEEMKSNSVPGLILLPNGIYATMRAQEAGCAYIRCP